MLPKCSASMYSVHAALILMHPGKFFLHGAQVDNYYIMKVTRAFSSSLDRQVAEKVDISNFNGPVLMNRRNKMGGVRIERQQYRRWGGNS